MQLDLLLLELRLHDVLPLTLGSGVLVNLVFRIFQEYLEILLACRQNTLHIQHQVLHILLCLLKIILLVLDFFNQQVIKLLQIDIETANVALLIKLEQTLVSLRVMNLRKDTVDDTLDLRKELVADGK